jgi:cytochrome b561
MKNKFTKLHRLLHWVAAVAMTVLFITGFLRMKWMSKGAIADAINNKTLEAPLSKEQIGSIIKTIREPMWQWHEIFAKVMIITLIVRIIYMLLKGIKFTNPFKSNVTFKERIQGLTYVYFYVFVFISACTGICLENGFFANYEDAIEDIHKWGLYWFPIFIILHIGGVYIAEHSKQKGITSKMISGD